MVSRFVSDTCLMGDPAWLVLSFHGKTPQRSSPQVRGYTRRSVAVRPESPKRPQIVFESLHVHHRGTVLARQRHGLAQLRSRLLTDLVVNT